MLNRRQFLTTASAAAWASSLPGQAKEPPAFEICAFIKFIQDLSYEEMAQAIAPMGYAGIEATIRKGGLIEPERVADALPKLTAALAKENLGVTIMASDVTRADDPLIGSS